MENKTKRFTYWLEVAALGIMLGLVIQAARAWTEPSASPPGGNVGAPINTSDVQQTKGGPLTVNSSYSFLNGLGVVGNALISGNVGIGTIGPVQKLHIVGGKGQADDFCLNSDTTKCLANSGGGGGAKVFVPVTTWPIVVGSGGMSDAGSCSPDCASYSWPLVADSFPPHTSGVYLDNGSSVTCGPEETSFSQYTTECQLTIESGMPYIRVIGKQPARVIFNRTIPEETFADYKVPGNYVAAGKKNGGMFFACYITATHEDAGSNIEKSKTKYYLTGGWLNDPGDSVRGLMRCRQEISQ